MTPDELQELATKPKSVPQPAGKQVVAWYEKYHPEPFDILRLAIMLLGKVEDQEVPPKP